MTVDPPVGKSDRAYRWLRQRIGNRDFTPGYRLVLGAIAAELDMSVVPVREAIRRLEAEGLVTFERNVGARVAMVDPTEYVQVMQTLAIIEGAATGLAAATMNHEILSRATELNKSMKAQLANFDPATFTSLNKQFHATLYSGCTNTDLLALIHRGWARLAGLRYSTFAFVPGRASESVAEHDHLLRLIGDGADPSEVEAFARRHRWATIEAFQQSQ